MTNEQILTKAIEKAIAGGWNHADEFEGFELLDTMLPEGAKTDIDPSVFDIKHKTLELQNGDYVNVAAVIFNHDFAKSLFGTELHNGQPEWRNALQYMVVQDDPIEALERLIDK